MLANCRRTGPCGLGALVIITTGTPASLALVKAFAASGHIAFPLCNTPQTSHRIQSYWSTIWLNPVMALGKGMGKNPVGISPALTGTICKEPQWEDWHEFCISILGKEKPLCFSLALLKTGQNGFKGRHHTIYSGRRCLCSCSESGPCRSVAWHG